MSKEPVTDTATAGSKRGSAHTVGGRPMWLLWPNVIVVALVVAVPFLIAAYTSFLSINQYTLRSWIRAPWVGLQNYADALTGGNILSTSALESLGVSVAFSLLTTLVITPIGILAALTVNTEFRGRALIRSLYLVPDVIPTFVTALLWRMMFMNGTGLVDRFLAALHVSSINTYWIVGPKSFWAMTITEIWAVWAFIYIMVLAGLQSIPVELYEVHLKQGLINSLIISGISSLLAVVVAVGAGYVLIRFNFRGRFPYLYSLVALQTVPQVMLLLPLFVLFASIQTAIPFQLIGTYQGPIITYLTFALPLATWLMVSYLASIPVELEEAALVDGATRFQALRKVVVPLALPGMVVALVFSFLTGWNDVLFASVLTSQSTRTLAVQLQSFSASQQGGSLPLYGQLMGAAVVSALPVVVLYMVFQRYLIGGLTAGGVKG